MRATSSSLATHQYKARLFLRYKVSLHYCLNVCNLVCSMLCLWRHTDKDSFVGIAVRCLGVTLLVGHTGMTQGSAYDND